MKKFTILLFISILTASLFIGCFKSDAETVSELNKANEVAQEQSSENSEQDTKSDIRVVGNAPGKSIFSKGVGTESGYYDYIKWNPEMYQNESDSQYTHIANLTYADYESGTRTYLCSVPGCLHNNEKCTSFIRYSYGITLFTNSDNTALFCITLNLPKGGEIIDDSDFSRIYRMDMDGSNRKELLKLDANQSFRTYSTDTILADKQHIYLTISTVEDAEKNPKREYVKLDIDTGEYEILFELNGLEASSSIFGDTIGIVDRTSTKSITDFSTASEQREIELAEFPNGETSGITCLGYSLSNKTKDKLYDWTTIYGTLIDNYHFAVGKTSIDFGSLIVVDLETGERKDIENIPANSAGVIRLHDFYDNKIMWGFKVRSSLEDTIVTDKSLVKTDDTEKQYIIDIDTGEVSEFTLKYNEGAEQESFVNIIHATDDFFYVAMDIDINSTIEMTDRQGVTRAYSIPKSVCALIDKDDYYNSIPNYRIIEDLI